MYNDYNKSEYASIEGIIKTIENGKLILPEFQRKFTWNIEQSVDLFDSLARGIFIGSLIMARPKFDLTCRSFDTNPRKGPGSRKKILEHFYRERDFEIKEINVLLDGQQRITSLYRALKGFDKVYFVLKEEASLPGLDEDIESIEQIIDGFSSEKQEGKVYFSVDDIYKSSMDDWREKKIKKEIFEPALADSSLQLTEDLIELYFESLLKLRRLFSRIVSNNTLLSVFLLDMDLEKFCMFFERSNSKGISLNFIDIITAKIYVGFKLKKEIEEAEEKHNIKLDNPTLESFVRYISYLKTGKVDRKSILTSVDHVDFKVHWNNVCDLYAKTISFLKSQKLIIGLNWLPYKSMLIPIMHFLSYLPSKDFSQRSEQQDNMLKLWFWGSLYNNRYGGGTAGSTNIVIAEDCDILENVSLNETLSKEFLKKLKFNFTFDDLLYITSRGAKFNCIMSLMNYSSNLKDWVNNGDINMEEKIEVHHIFPVNYIETKFGEESTESEYMDSILNKVIIDKITNIKFKDKAPSKYLNEILNKNTSIVSSMDTHLIPNVTELINGDYDNDFMRFLKERYNLIIKLLETHLVNSYKEFAKKED
ncbi:DUF262 domain-containing protein [Bacillus tianshenii]|uniref:DUF262 domain-containing protein n=1 Tax=Sutcliffiella tianshenii TaxID=1463404 RepID=UPI001CD69969|nr:DUF262 domain-containing protein [Bacillus tianshenii]MCA1318373.1 DUF262 domain-containing protein [Bacillus tianshenii]